MRRATWALLGLLGALGAAGLVTAAVFGVRTPGPFGIQQPQVWVLIGLLPGYLTGLVLVAIRPAQRVSRLLLVMFSAMAVATALGAITSRLIDVDPGASWLWLPVVAQYVADLAGPAAMCAMFLLFPDGRTRWAYERWILAIAGALVVVLPPLLLMSHERLPAPVYAESRAALVPSPLTVPWLTGAAPLITGGFLAATQLGLLGAALLVVRYRRLPAGEREQTHWLLLAGLAVLADVVVVQLLTGYGVLPRSVQLTTFYAIWVPALAFIPVAILIALVRHRLFDVHLAVRRSLLYGAASAMIGAAYLLVAAVLGVTAGQRLPLVVAVGVTIAVMLALHPVRRRLNRWASAWAYGKRVDAAALLSTFGETLEHAYDLRELAPRAAEGLRDGLGLTWARVSLRLPGSEITEPIGAAGVGLDDQVEPVLVVPLVDRDEVVGQLECGPPTVGGEPSAENRRMLDTVARQTALAVRNAHFAAELAGQLAEIRRQSEAIEESRRRLVDAQDTERRRLERDLHDGVQQEVVAVIAQLRLGLDQLERDPSGARDTFEDARRTAMVTLTELRELAQGIRPPVLADRGLLTAVETLATRAPIAVSVDAEPEMRTARFPAEVESAAYFVVAEALTNVMKHANADHVRVSLSLQEDRLHLTVSDDGVGFLPADAHGSGLTGLADRIAAVGGSLRVASRAGEGTRLRAELPAVRLADV